MANLCQIKPFVNPALNYLLFIELLLVMYGLIQNKIETRHEDRLDTIGVWVPSNTGLNGNDRVNSVSLEGSGLPEVGLAISPSLFKLRATSSNAIRSFPVDGGPTPRHSQKPILESSYHS